MFTNFYNTKWTGDCQKRLLHLVKAGTGRCALHLRQPRLVNYSGKTKLIFIYLAKMVK